MNLFKRTNAKREAAAGLAPKETSKETPKDKPKRTMAQAEFSGYGKPKKPEEKFSCGGKVGKRGWGIARKG